MYENTSLIIFVGPSYSGKDALERAMIRHNIDINVVPTYTTRPMRKNEKQGIGHTFIDFFEFKDIKDKGEMIIADEYGNEQHGKYWYGTGKNQLVPGKLNLLKINPYALLAFLLSTDMPMEQITIVDFRKTKQIRWQNALSEIQNEAKDKNLSYEKVRAMITSAEERINRNETEHDSVYLLDLLDEEKYCFNHLVIFEQEGKTEEEDTDKIIKKLRLKTEETK